MTTEISTPDKIDPSGQEKENPWSWVEHVSRTWTVENYKSVLNFQLKIIPQLMGCERCAAYIIEPGSEKTCRFMATGIMEKSVPIPEAETVVGRVISSGKASVVNEADNLLESFSSWGISGSDLPIRALVCAPLHSLTGSGIRGAILAINKKTHPKFEPEDKTRLLVIATYLSISLESILLNRELLQLYTKLSPPQSPPPAREAVQSDLFVSTSSAARRAKDQIHLLQNNSANVFIIGEPGTEKEQVARDIHTGSPRRDRPFVRINCATVPDNLAEGEFFGLEKGGSVREGLLEKANGGTLYLENVTDLPAGIQAKLLSAIKEGKGFRQGSNRAIDYDLRFICSTDKDLKQLIADGKIDQELLFYLSTAKVLLSPLRNRREDIIPLALRFVQEISSRIKRKNNGFSKEVLEAFEIYPWPENIRQLRNEIDRMVALTDSEETITMEKCSLELQQFYQNHRRKNRFAPSSSLLPEQVKTLEKELIVNTLTETRYNRVKAAKLLGITRQGLYKKMKRYQIE
jgi:Nif-specific regulatory protein/two-component system response regulator HydG